VEGSLPKPQFGTSGKDHRYTFIEELIKKKSVIPGVEHS
jgi:hypothetical protein